MSGGSGRQEDKQEVAAEPARRGRLLRDEVFRSRVLPEWYRPAPGPRPLSPGALTALSVLLIAGFVLVLATVTHERSHGAMAFAVEPGLNCRPPTHSSFGSTAAGCLLTLRVDSQERAACPDEASGDRIRLAGMHAGSRAQVLSCTRTPAGMELKVSIPADDAAALSGDALHVEVTRKRSLLGWLVSSLQRQGETA